MKKLLLSVAVLLLVGGGCTGTEPNTKSANDLARSKSAVDDIVKDIPGPDKNTSVINATEGDLVLTAQATGNQTAHFEWNVGEALAKDAEGYRFVWGLDANPTDPSNYWWERGPSWRELDWEELPKGPAHFRACVVVNDKCEVYSNDVVVEVK